VALSGDEKPGLHQAHGRCIAERAELQRFGLCFTPRLVLDVPVWGTGFREPLLSARAVACCACPLRALLGAPACMPCREPSVCLSVFLSAIGVPWRACPVVSCLSFCLLLGCLGVCAPS
jgi:hypothetical protein